MLTLEFVWTAEDFEDLLADQAAEQHDKIFEEIIQSEDFDVWRYLDSFKNLSPYPDKEEL